MLSCLVNETLSVSIDTLGLISLSLSLPTVILSLSNEVGTRSVSVFVSNLEVNTKLEFLFSSFVKCFQTFLVVTWDHGVRCCLSTEAPISQVRWELLFSSLWSFTSLAASLQKFPNCSTPPFPLPATHLPILRASQTTFSTYFSTSFLIRL